MTTFDDLKIDLRVLIRNYVQKPSRENKAAIRKTAGLPPEASIAALIDEDYKARTKVSTSGLYEERPASKTGEVLATIPAETAKFNPPLCLTGDPPDALLIHYQQPRHSPAVKIYEIAGASSAVSYFQKVPVCYRGDDPVSITPDISGLNYEAIYFFGGRRAWVAPAVKVNELAVIHDRFLGNNYCHWLLDWFIRAILIKEVDLPKTTFLALPTKPTRYMKECLSKIGFDEARILPVKNHQHFAESTISTDRLWASSSSGADWRHALHYGANWALERLRSRLYKGPTEKRSILLQRRQYRRLQLDDNALDALARNGFQTIYAEDLPLEEQIKIFSGAERVIAPHGAGLANIAFCPENAAILEVFPPIHATSAFWFVSKAAHLRYACAVGTLIEHEQARMPTDHDIGCSTQVISAWLDSLA